MIRDLMLHSLNTILSNYSYIIALLSALIPMIAVFIALYGTSSYAEIRKQRKIKLAKFNEKTNSIYNDMMGSYLKFIYESRRDQKFEDYIKWNHLPLEYSNYSSSFKDHQGELEFFDYLVSKRVLISRSSSVVESAALKVFAKYQYTLFPSPKSWKLIIDRYNKTPYKKNQDKLGKQIIDALFVQNRSRRMFLGKLFPFLN
jgi:hypothetical protein